MTGSFPCTPSRRRRWSCAACPTHAPCRCAASRAALQGLPYSINGVGDLLALFRCISCKYKFATDVCKAQQMGAGALARLAAAFAAA